MTLAEAIERSISQSTIVVVDYDGDSEAALAEIREIESEITEHALGYVLASNGVLDVWSLAPEGIIWRIIVRLAEAG